MAPATVGSRDRLRVAAVKVCLRAAPIMQPSRYTGVIYRPPEPFVGSSIEEQRMEQLPALSAHSMRAAEEEPPTVAGRPMSLIGVGIAVIGNITAQVDVTIEGQVHGDVKCAGLILGSEGLIKGGVIAERIKVSGSLEGTIDASDLAIESEGRVSADISYRSLRVANGASLDGQLRRKTQVAVEPIPVRESKGRNGKAPTSDSE